MLCERRWIDAGPAGRVGQMLASAMRRAQNRAAKASTLLGTRSVFPRAHYVRLYSRVKQVLLTAHGMKEKGWKVKGGREGRGSIVKILAHCRAEFFG